MGYSNDGPCLKLTLSFLKVKKYSSAYMFLNEKNRNIEYKIILNIYFDN